MDSGLVDMFERHAQGLVLYPREWADTEKDGPSHVCEASSYREMEIEQPSRVASLQGPHPGFSGCHSQQQQRLLSNDKSR